MALTRPQKLFYVMCAVIEVGLIYVALTDRDWINASSENAFAKVWVRVSPRHVQTRVLVQTNGRVQKLSATEWREDTLSDLETDVCAHGDGHGKLPREKKRLWKVPDPKHNSIAHSEKYKQFDYEEETCLFVSKMRQIGLITLGLCTATILLIAGGALQVLRLPDPNDSLSSSDSGNSPNLYNWNAVNMRYKVQAWQRIIGVRVAAMLLEIVVCLLWLNPNNETRVWRVLQSIEYRSSSFQVMLPEITDPLVVGESWWLLVACITIIIICLFS
eukprot:Platyproteum_vivax@DN7794_c0_g1_i1.p1